MHGHKRERRRIETLTIALTLFLAFTQHMQASGEKVIFHFEPATNASSSWQVVNDGVMGGLSRSRFLLTNGVAVFAGEVSLENNGGFASVRSQPEALNMAGAEALILRVKGDGQKYKFTARTDADFDSALYQCGFETRKGEWQEHRIPMSAFAPTFRGRVLSNHPPLDPAKIVSLGFLISDKQAGPFRLEIAWIKVAGEKR